MILFYSNFLKMWLLFYSNCLQTRLLIYSNCLQRNYCKTVYLFVSNYCKTVCFNVLSPVLDHCRVLILWVRGFSIYFITHTICNLYCDIQVLSLACVCSQIPTSSISESRPVAKGFINQFI
jgi:hypothetical protein